ncbi:MAG: hypothetical protein HOE48_22390 [Candidatus Latescibacteria bacterium]|jgi:hypothetical protein|nr:hypothetical protein [Candidatus Latescibacterota bacterium]MBT4140678.1 hypothetical protein [Candidatus Latescibacterota bacterium]MBT5830784.1 hypothetical protein [Candidatus Latescibacterota bacterium]
MKLIFLHGPPAAGKFTIAKEEEPEWAKGRNVKERVVVSIKKTIELMDTMFPTP